MVEEEADPPNLAHGINPEEGKRDSSSDDEEDDMQAVAVREQ